MLDCYTLCLCLENDCSISLTFPCFFFSSGLQKTQFAKLKMVITTSLKQHNITELFIGLPIFCENSVWTLSMSRGKCQLPD